MNLLPSAIDLTTVGNVNDWLSDTKFNQKETNVVQGMITSAGEYWIRRTGRGPQTGVVPGQSPFVQSIPYSETYDGTGNSRLYLRNWPVNTVTSVLIGPQSIPASSAQGNLGYIIDGDAQSIVLRGGYGSMPNGLLTVGFGSLQNWGGSGFGERGYGGRGAQGSPRFTYGLQNVNVSYAAGFPSIPQLNELHTVDVTADPIATLYTWLADNGVKYFTSGDPLTRVYVAPTIGQYYINSLNQYIFAVADADQVMMISYQSPGTPPDIIEKSTEMVAINYKRRQWIDQKSQMLSSGGGTGTVSYRDWELTPGIERVIEYYKRRATS